MKKFFIFALCVIALGSCSQNAPDSAKVSVVDGAIRAEFSVSASKQVYFSQGNLQYQPSTGIWSFAENQYDVIGEENEKVSETYTGKIDLFGWGTSGYNDKYPYMTDTEPLNYGDGENEISDTYYDWGVYNGISNGGKTPGRWRTPTADEWAYLFTGRKGAISLYFRATVNEVAGLVVLPDNWLSVSGVPADYTLGAEGFSNNIISETDWKGYEKHGAVFLPCVGNRLSTNVTYVDSEVYYWSSTYADKTNAYAFTCATFYFDPAGANSRAFGFAVRLVTDAAEL